MILAGPTACPKTTPPATPTSAIVSPYIIVVGVGSGCRYSITIATLANTRTPPTPEPEKNASMLRSTYRTDKWNSGGYHFHVFILVMTLYLELSIP